MENRKFLTGILFAIATMVVAGCDQKIPRKRLPPLSITDEIEGDYVPFQGKIQENDDEYAFNVSDVDILTGGTMQACISVPISAGVSDSAIAQLLDTYRPFAIPLVTQWSKQTGKGVVLDFRSEGSKVFENAGGRADYVLEKQNAFSVPVIFLWDKISASRASAYMNVLKRYAGECSLSIRETEK